MVFFPLNTSTVQKNIEVISLDRVFSSRLRNNMGITYCYAINEVTFLILFPQQIPLYINKIISDKKTLFSKQYLELSFFVILANTIIYHITDFNVRTQQTKINAFQALLALYGVLENTYHINSGTSEYSDKNIKHIIQGVLQRIFLCLRNNDVTPLMLSNKWILEEETLFWGTTIFNVVIDDLKIISNVLNNKHNNIRLSHQLTFIDKLLTDKKQRIIGIYSKYYARYLATNPKKTHDKQLIFPQIYIDSCKK